MGLSPRHDPMTGIGHQLPSSRRSGPAGRGLWGYTLVEVIVCLGVIAVLCGVLLPSLRATREQSRRLGCASNMRSVGVAIMAYAQTNDGRLPYSSVLENTPPDVGALMLARLASPGDGPQAWDGLGRLANTYLDTCECLYCPSHHGMNPAESCVERYRDGSITELATNFQYSGHKYFHANSPNRGERITLDEGSKTLLLTDGLRSRLDFNHDTGLNRLFADLSTDWWADERNAVRNRLPNDPVTTASSALSEEISAVWGDIAEDDRK